jgi:hypothetical protein
VGYFNAEDTVVNRPFTFAPNVVTVPMMTIEMPPAINAYSIAVAPPVFRAKRRSNVQIAVVEDFIMVRATLFGLPFRLRFTTAP